jgi:hypothetical protein
MAMTQEFNGTLLSAITPNAKYRFCIAIVLLVQIIVARNVRILRQVYVALKSLPSQKIAGPPCWYGLRQEIKKHKSNVTSITIA